MRETRTGGCADEKGGHRCCPPVDGAQSGRGEADCLRLSGWRGFCSGVGGKPYLGRVAAYQKKDAQGEQNTQHGLSVQGGFQPPEFDDLGDQRGKQNGGQAAACGRQTQGQTPPGIKPVGDDQGKGDHSAVAIGQSGEGGGGTVDRKGAGGSKQGVGGGKAGHPHGHGVPQSQSAAQSIHREHGQQGKQTAHGGDPGALGIGKLVDLDDPGLIDGKDVDSQAHHREQGQGAAQADGPGPVRPGTKLSHDHSPFPRLFSRACARWFVKIL